MTLLDRKLLRDLSALKSQAVAVALVMACGLTMMIMTRSLILSLETTRDVYYRDYHWPIFNVADSAITIGAALMAIELFLAPQEKEVVEPINGE